MSWQGSTLRAAIEAGDFEIAARQYAEDAILDVTVDSWRFQVQGRHNIRRQLAADYGGRVTYRRWKERPTPWGVVVEVEAVQGEESEPTFFRWVQLIELEDDLIIRDTIYCGGAWDRATVERWRRQDPMVERVDDT